MRNIVGIIPARMGSSRFPGKPLAKLCGLPMIEHVYRRCLQSQVLSGVYVATCDEEIRHAVESFGGKVIMTKSSHPRASDRTAEAMLKVEAMLGKEIDIVVMIQGDEPMVYPQMIDESVKPLLEDRSIKVANLLAPIQTMEEHRDPNTIKVIVDQQNFALYFSRLPIPSREHSSGAVPMFKQICIIPFQRDYLLEFSRLAQTPLERAESVDMMRVLEYGQKVKMVPTHFQTHSVDTPSDLEKVSVLMEKDELFLTYKNESIHR